MKDNALRSAVTRAVLTELAAGGEFWAPVATSSRHCHLSPADLERLFGRPLTPLRMLEQPGQFAAEEKVTLETPKGKLSLRVVGPVRKESQVEISLTEARQLGLNPPIRLSGDLENSPGCRLTCGDRSVDLSRGVIAAARHLHISGEEAAVYGLRDGEEVSLRSDGPRSAVMEHVIVRAGAGHVLEAHIDTDEANAFGIRSGQLCRLLLQGEAGRGLFPAGAPGARPAVSPPAPPAGAQIPGAGRVPPPVSVSPRQAVKETLLDYSGDPGFLLTEELLYRAAARGMKYIRLAPGALVTPLARDVAWEKGIELIRQDGRNDRG